jgi:hypothetical protein
MPAHVPSPRRRPAFTRFTAVALVVIALLLGACSDSVSPPADNGNQLDPANGTFTLKDISLPGTGGADMLLRLEGSDLQSDPATGTVSLSVQVRNLSDRDVTAPLVVWLRDLRPADVVPLNADFGPPLPDKFATTDTTIVPPDASAWGFDYTGLLDGGRLPAGGATAAKTWIFSDASLGAFSFSADITCGDPAPGAQLGGLCFVDTDGDGAPDPGEPPFFAGGVQVTGPDGTVTWAMPGPDGRWTVDVAVPGLYEAFFMSLSMSPLPVELTTPNPLSVVIPAGPDGEPQGWLGADFGIARGWTPPPAPGAIQFTDRRPGQLHVAPWTLLGSDQWGPLLSLQVGYSGCGPDHAFSLWMSGGFQETSPPRAVVTLVHETQEMCDAYFTQNVGFDLLPLYERYLQQYGPGRLVLVLNGPDGFTQELPVSVVDSIYPMKSMR